MPMPNDMGTDGIFSSICRYIDVRFEGAKLKAADGISSVISQIVTWLIIAVMLAFLVCVLDVALMQWLNDIFGRPYGTLVAAGVLLIIIAVLFLLRKRLFTATLGKSIADAMGLHTSNVKADLAAAESERLLLESKFDESKSGIVNEAISGIVLAATIIRRIRKRFKSE